LNRPFDDQTQGRIRLEADAVLLILQNVEDGGWCLLDSDAIHIEMSQTIDPYRLGRVQEIITKATVIIPVNHQVAERAEALERQGFSDFDALHLACAEAGQADVLLTTDDKLLKRAHRLASELRIRVENPVAWYTEIITND
jgi:predicted nucleic acid-binding protein